MLIREGWSPWLANYYVSNIESESKHTIIKRGQWLLWTGLGCVVAGGIAIAATYQIAGIMPTSGPLVVIWGTVVCGGLRFVGGLLYMRCCRMRTDVPEAGPQRDWPAELEEDLALLGLPPQASAEQIRTAYRKLVKLWHPDQFSRFPDLQKCAEERLRRVNGAYGRVRGHRS